MPGKLTVLNSTVSMNCVKRANDFVAGREFRERNDEKRELRADGNSYDKETETGGSNGATMRFAPEGDHGANAGLKAARDFMEPVKGRPFLPLSLSTPLSTSY